MYIGVLDMHWFRPTYDSPDTTSDRQKNQPKQWGEQPSSAMDQLTSDGSTTWRYGRDGLNTQITGTKTSEFIEPYRDRITDNGVITDVRYYVFAGQRIAKFTTVPGSGVGTLTFLYQDALGSGVEAIDSTEEWAGYSGWGNGLGSTLSKTDFRFQGGRNDSTTGSKSHGITPSLRASLKRMLTA